MLELSFTDIIIENAIRLKGDFMGRTGREPRYLYAGDMEAKALRHAGRLFNLHSVAAGIDMPEQVDGMTMIEVKMHSFLRVGD